jgi:polyisoprenoid-binding protein YceI
MPTIPPMLRRARTWLIAIPVLVLLVAVVGPFVYIHFIEGDPPARLTLDDAVVPTSSTTAGSSTTGDGSSTTADASTASTGSAAATDGVAGAWKVTSGSQAGYRAKETLFGQDADAVGRTTSVTGTMTISGTTVTAADITVDMTSVSSDRSQRDGQFRNRIMSTDQFPTATFKLTKPIDLGSLPADGTQRSYKATGELTLRGVTKTVTVTLTTERKSGTIVVNGTIPIAFDDYDIPDASGGPATVGRSGEIELLVVFAR